MARRVNYLNNKDLLKEIAKSKNTYSYYVDESYEIFDVIVPSVDDIPDYVDDAKAARAKRIKDQMVEKLKAEGKSTRGKDAVHVDPNSIDESELVFRVMTFEHIPERSEPKKNPKKEADYREKVNFPPYKHYAFVDDKVKEVGRSHWKGGLDNGYFSTDHGKINNKLAFMYLKLVERYSTRSNWRGYTYVDEMRGQALMQLSQIGLQFDESKGNNPFAYYTAAITNSFTRVLNIEKKNQNIRDDILQDSGMNPSFTRQIEHEMNMKKLLEEQKINTYSDFNEKD